VLLAQSRLVGNGERASYGCSTVATSPCCFVVSARMMVCQRATSSSQIAGAHPLRLRMLGVARLVLGASALRSSIGERGQACCPMGTAPRVIRRLHLAAYGPLVLSQPARVCAAQVCGTAPAAGAAWCVSKPCWCVCTPTWRGDSWCWCDPATSPCWDERLRCVHRHVECLHVHSLGKKHADAASAQASCI
jgi:hypothetical protein